MHAAAVVLSCVIANIRQNKNATQRYETQRAENPTDPANVDGWSSEKKKHKKSKKKKRKKKKKKRGLEEATEEDSPASLRRVSEKRKRRRSIYTKYIGWDSPENEATYCVHFFFSTEWPRFLFVENAV